MTTQKRTVHFVFFMTLNPARNKILPTKVKCSVQSGGGGGGDFFFFFYRGICYLAFFFGHPSCKRIV